MWVALAAFLAAALLAPESALGGWAVDLRLPAFFAVLLFASADLRLPHIFEVATGIVLIALAFWNAASLLKDWLPYDRQFDEFRAAIRALPSGVRIMTIVVPPERVPDSGQAYWHMAEYAILDRAAFTSLMFTTPAQHVIQSNPPFDRYAAGSADQGTPPEIGVLDDLSVSRLSGAASSFPNLAYFPYHYDIALVIADKGVPMPGSLRLRYSGSFFSLYDLSRNSCHDNR